MLINDLDFRRAVVAARQLQHVPVNITVQTYATIDPKCV